MNTRGGSEGGAAPKTDPHDCLRHHELQADPLTRSDNVGQDSRGQAAVVEANDDLSASFEDILPLNAVYVVDTLEPRSAQDARDVCAATQTYHPRPTRLA